MTGYYRDLGYRNIDNYWWLVPGKSMENGLRALKIGKDQLDLYRDYSRNDKLIYLYFDHVVAEPKEIVYLCNDEAPEDTDGGKDMPQTTDGGEGLGLGVDGEGIQPKVSGGELQHGAEVRERSPPKSAIK